MGCPVQPRAFSAILTTGEETVVGNMGSRLAATVCDVEASNRLDAIGGLTKGNQGFAQTESEGANDAGSYHGNSGQEGCSV